MSKHSKTKIKITDLQNRSKPHKNFNLLFLILLSIIVPVVFSPCFSHQFLHWDDNSHFYANPCVYSLSWNNLCRLFEQTVNETYIPLTTLSFNIEYHFFGLSPIAAHAINIFLHLATVLAIYEFALLLKFSPWESFVASLIFALHPLHVESVAWVTERKDVLSIWLYVLSLIHYVKYIEGYSKRSYYLSVLLGLLSVLAKPMAVSLPWVLLLLDWYLKRENNKERWLDKIPFVVFIFPIALMTFFNFSNQVAAGHHSMLIGIWSSSWYLEKFFWPLQLLAAYTPAVPVDISNPVYITSIVIVVIFLTAIMWGRNNRLFIFACLFWIATIFFFWRSDFNDIDILADRFMYLPSLGLCLFFGRLVAKFKIVSILLFIVLGFLTFNQCQIWHDDLTLWTWTLNQDPKNELARLKQDAAIFYQRNKLADYKQLTDAIDRNPNDAQSYLDRGTALVQEKDYFLAIDDFNQAIEKSPENYMAYNMRGQMESIKGDYKKAIADFDRALQLRSDDTLAILQKASIYENMKQYDQAEIYLNQAIRINPNLHGAYQERGMFYKSRGEYLKAIDDFSEAIALGDSLKVNYFLRGECFESLKQFEGAIEDFKSALKLDPYDIKVINELGFVYMVSNNFVNALSEFNKAIAYHPFDENAYINRGDIYIQEGQYALALMDFIQAIRHSLYPYHPLITRGDIYFALGDSQDALKDYNRAMLFSNGDSVAQIKRDHLIQYELGLK